MLTKIVMPSMGATMEQGTIIEWRVNEGDVVNAGTILCELETDKSTFDFESPIAGIIRKLAAKAGDTVAVGELIAVIGAPAEEIPLDWFTTTKKQTVNEAAPTPVADAIVEQIPASDKVKISPRAKKLAVELGIDFTQIKGSGPGGRIESIDIVNT